MRIDRREFLKLAALLPISSILRPVIKLKPTQIISNPNAKNILIIVFDALSACNVSFQGYPRETMPKLSQLLERAVVYHQHYASGNYTSPGTASLLTGTLPWTHRAVRLLDIVAPEVVPFNIFTLFDNYYRIAYTHNPFADVLLDQFNEHIHHYKPREELYLNTNWWIDRYFKGDFDAASLTWTRIIDTKINGLVYSLIFSKYLDKYLQKIPSAIVDLFPKGLPGFGQGNTFLLEHAINWIEDGIKDVMQPFFGYYHLAPPHNPYRTRREFVDTFLEDGWEPPNKDFHHISPKSQKTREELLRQRRDYDEYILYVDSEFDRLFTNLEQGGFLENTWVVVTTDHGETFERGFFGHGSPHLYQPLVKIPLIIFEPGRESRKDIFSPTSCVDVLPTLLHLTDHTIPDRLEGEILPPYRNTEIDPDRGIYALQAKLIPNSYGPLVSGTMMSIKDRMKTIRYFGYQNAYDYEIEMESDPFYEVYNIENDPEEMNNLARQRTTEVKVLIEELEEKYHEVGGAYR
jgi:arylsulfatase A-like enzyme